MSQQKPFWEELTLAQMDQQQWESLCDGCGKCCLHKLIDDDTDELVHTNVVCNLLDCDSCRCSNYPQRFEFEPDCIQLTIQSLETFDWLPPSCSYRLIKEGKPLPAWHPCVAAERLPCSAPGYGLAIRLFMNGMSRISRITCWIIPFSFQAQLRLCLFTSRIFFREGLVRPDAFGNVGDGPCLYPMERGLLQGALNRESI
ncbi:YcgN family cysteine cluster protein [Dongshaea marina]|uniref:YcgN family cysteine cluster protein n=1 Tax=Dongshaea marina TaxID=2047966 RepID=UPI003898E5F1